MIVHKNPLYPESIDTTYVHQITLSIEDYEKLYEASHNTHDRYSYFLIFLDHSHTLADYLYHYDEHAAAAYFIEKILAKYHKNEFNDHISIQEKFKQLSTISDKIITLAEQYILKDSDASWNASSAHTAPFSLSPCFDYQQHYQQSDYDFADSLLH